VHKFPFGSTRLAARQLRREGFEHCSAATVLRDARWLRIRCRRRRRAPLQTPLNKQARLYFSKLTLRKSLSYHRMVLFSDEKWFNTDDHGFLHQWVAEGEETTPRATDLYPRKIIIWGCIGVGFKFLTIHVREEDPNRPKPKRGRPKKGEVRQPVEKAKPFSIDHQVYIDKCLAPMLVELRRKGRSPQEIVFMQDGATCHKHGKVMAWLKDNNIAVLGPWPARSPDLNPIENLWAVLAKRVSDRGPIDEAGLAEFVRAEWKKLSQQTVDNFVLSFRGRLRACRDAGGEAMHM